MRALRSRAAVIVVLLIHRFRWQCAQLCYLRRLTPPTPPPPQPLVLMPVSSRFPENCRPRSSGDSSSPSPIPTPRARRDKRKALHPRADESEDGYSSHPSVYSASPVGSSDSECGRTVDGVADSDRVQQRQSDAGVFEQDVEEAADGDRGGNGGLAGRRNFSNFSGLSLLDAISERKSVNSSVVLNDDAEGTGDEEFCGDGYSTDDELGYEYGRPFYYEYASPTQPLHPARPRSAPPRGERLCVILAFSWNLSSAVRVLAAGYIRGNPRKWSVGGLIGLPVRSLVSVSAVRRRRHILESGRCSCPIISYLPLTFLSAAPRDKSALST